MATSFDLETAEFEFVISQSAMDTGRPKPASSAVHIDFAAVSDRGKVRDQNEDHFLVSKVSRKQEVLSTNVRVEQIPPLAAEDGYAMIVADGMGGMAAGEVASSLAITTALEAHPEVAEMGLQGQQERGARASRSDQSTLESHRRNADRAE